MKYSEVKWASVLEHGRKAVFRRSHGLSYKEGEHAIAVYVFIHLDETTGLFTISRSAMLNVCKRHGNLIADNLTEFELLPYLSRMEPNL